MKIVNHSKEEAYIKLSQSRDQALKILEDVREDTQGPAAGRSVKYITGQRVELKQPGNEPCEGSEN